MEQARRRISNTGRLTVVVLCFVVAGVAQSCTGSDSTGEEAQKPTANERLAGDWRPLGVTRAADSADRWRLVFEADGQWHGFDACNRAVGIFALHEDGTFEGGPLPDDFQGGSGCSSEEVDYFHAFEATERVVFKGNRATFLSAEGDKVLVLTRLG